MNSPKKKIRSRAEFYLQKLDFYHGETPFFPLPQPPLDGSRRRASLPAARAPRPALAAARPSWPPLPPLLLMVPLSL